jgi:hypothetical protein
MPLQENEEISEIADAIERASRDAVKKGTGFFFVIDLDENLYWIEEKEPSTGETEPEADVSDDYFRPSLVFVRAKNARQDLSSGRIRFMCFPDGTNEFGSITILDSSLNRDYTIFINPYFSSPEILEGDVDFEGQYAL